MSIGNELWSVKSIKSGNDFVCSRSFSCQKEESWDQSGGEAPSQEESSMEESSPFCKLLWSMRLSGSEGSRPRSEDIACGEYDVKESELDAGDGAEQDIETVVGWEVAKTRSGPTQLIYFDHVVLPQLPST